jgi:Ca2+-binding EF-hand superfamily protein
MLCHAARIFVVITGLPCALQAAEQTAPSASPLSGRMVQVMDRDRDGRITADEFSETAQSMFLRADRKGDGQLSQEDLAAYMGGRTNLLDANDDGMVSRAEYLNSGNLPFARLDAPGHDLPPAEFSKQLEEVFACLNRNKDGKLTENEQPPQGLFGDAKDPSAGPARVPPLAGLDEDGNGSLSKSEWMKSFTLKFNASDIDGNGVLTPDDLLGRTKTPDIKACEM